MSPALGLGDTSVPDSCPKAVVLLSGGLDSATSAAVARDLGFSLHALSFRYGQRHAIEIEAARRVARALPVTEHIIQTIDLRAFGGSALTDTISVPKPADLSEPGRSIPVTYVPARNTIFLSFALAYAEVIGSSDIFIGVSAVDYSGYPDCRPEFVEVFERLANLATKAGVEGGRLSIRAPLIHMSKADTVREGIRLGMDLGMTHSCYDPTESGLACGSCESCLLRRRGFIEAGAPDPTEYATGS